MSIRISLSSRTPSLRSVSARRPGSTVRTSWARRAFASASAALIVAVGISAGSAAAAPSNPEQSPSAPAQPAEKLPVPYTFLTGAIQELTRPGTPLAGANNWNCRPSPEHPRPVVLLHGTAGGGATNWATYGPLLANEGYCVFSTTYGNYPEAPWPANVFGGIRAHPEPSQTDVTTFIDRVLASTGAQQVDLIGHSQGTAVAGMVAKKLRPGKVGAVVSLAALWDGTIYSPFLAPLANITGSAASAVMNSAFDLPIALREMDGTPYAQGVRYTNIGTRYDEAVVPFTSGLTPAPNRPGYDVTNLVVQDGCEQDLADHVSLPADPRAADMALNALDPEHPRTLRCVPVAPIHGAIGPVPDNPAPAR